MLRLLALTGLSLVVGCATSPARSTAPRPEQAAPVTSTNLYIRIPDAIGAFKLTERATIRGIPTDSIFRFRDGSATILSLIIYEVPSDVKVGDDPQKWTQREGEKFRAVQEIRQNRGQISAFQVAFSDTARIAGAQQILEHSIAVPTRMPNGAVAVEMQFLYLIGGKFIKVRGTIPEQGWEQTQVPAFARELALRLAGAT